MQARQLTFEDRMLLINALEAEIAQPESIASDKRWEQAEQVWKALNEDGKTTREVANAWRKPSGESYSHVHVIHTAKAWEAFGGSLATKPIQFYEAYHSPEVRNSNGAHVSHNAGESEWFTKPELIAAAREVMGGIDLDPASTAIANEKIQATRFHSVDDDGLSQGWAGRVWMNPPYAQPSCSDFCNKLLQHYNTGDVTEACVLVNNATETEWLQQLAAVATAACFPRTRAWFWHPERESAPLQGQVVLYLGPNPRTFRNAFEGFGFTAEL